MEGYKKNKKGLVIYGALSMEVGFKSSSHYVFIKCVCIFLIFNFKTLNFFM